MTQDPSAMAVRISIIMPCRNAVRHLPASVGSVLAQSMPDWELIIIDDGSVDDSRAWIGSLQDQRIRLIAQPPRGVSSARNAGLSEARAPYIAFLDADDTWAPNFLRVMLETLSAHPEAVLAYCGWQNLGLTGPRGEPFIPPDYETKGKRLALFSRCRWPIHSVLVKQEAVAKAGGFNVTLQNAEDFALWLNIATQAPITRVPEVLAYYHFHDHGQASSNTIRASLHLLSAQQTYLRAHPDFQQALGNKKIRELTLGPILKQAYASYWKRDLPTARALFRTVMKHGYGTLRDWTYMLPALLPLSWHRAWLARRDTAGHH